MTRRVLACALVEAAALTAAVAVWRRADLAVLGLWPGLLPMPEPRGADAKAVEAYLRRRWEG